MLRWVIVIKDVSGKHFEGFQARTAHEGDEGRDIALHQRGSDVASAGFVGPRNKNKTQKYKIMENPFFHSKQSGKCRVGFALILAVALGSWVAPELHAQVVVVPNALATNDGNGSSTSTAGFASVRWLHIHDASEFGALSGPSFLTQFAYRPDRILGQSGPRSWNLRIFASTTRRSVDELSTTFAENLGTNNTLVFDGTVNVTTGNLPGPGNTRQFDYVVPFTTPFLYDPAAGNLVLDLQIVGNGSALTFDTVLSVDPAIGRIFSFSSSTATTGTIWADNLVTQFTFKAPPEVLGTWTRKADMITGRSGHASSVVNGKIYVFGGAPNGSGTSSISAAEVYDPVTNTNTALDDMTSSRAWAACAAVNGKIYLFGGDPAFLSNPLQTVEEYDPAGNTWTEKANMPTARSSSAAVAIEGKIYVIGGLTTWGSAVAEVEAYDPATNSWETKAPLPAPRGLLCAAVVDGKIYAIGSSLPPSGPWSRTVEMYDPKTNVWSQRASMPSARGALACAAVNGRIYVMGGVNSGTVSAANEEYDPRTDTWVKRAPIQMSATGGQTGLGAPSVREVNGRLYAMGGGRVFGGISERLVLEYTPPNLTPEARLSVQSVIREGKTHVRLEWPSHAEYFDLLQSHKDLHPTGWTDVERLSGTGETFIREFPAVGPAGFFRLQRERK